MNSSRPAGTRRFDEETYRNELLSTAEVLQDCVKAENILHKILAESTKEMVDLQDTIDDSVVSVNDEYLRVNKSVRGIQSAEDKVRSLTDAVTTIRTQADVVSEDNIEMITSLYDYRKIDAILTRNSTASGSSADAYRALHTKLSQVRFDDVPRHNNSFYSSLLNENGDIEDNDDFEIEETEINPYCPLTSKLLENPVRAKCGHYFSEEALNHMLSSSGSNQPCPSRGCNHRIGRGEAQRDMLMDYIVRKRARRERLASLQEKETLASI